MDEGERRDLLALFDSIERCSRQKRPRSPRRRAARRGASRCRSRPRRSEVDGKVNAKYNGFSHSFAGMGVQFVLFMGIEIGVGILLMRRMGLWKRLRAAPVSRTLLLGSRIARAR
jgi:ABC-2 type transport system permease protein